MLTVPAFNLLGGKEMGDLFAVLWLISSALFVGGIVVCIVAKIRKKQLKKPLLVTGILLLISVISLLASSMNMTDYTVMNETEGNKFYQEIDNGKTVEDKTLKFKVKQTGESSTMGMVVLEVPGKKELDIILPNIKATRKIKKDDVVTVKLDKLSSLMGIKMIDASLDNN